MKARIANPGHYLEYWMYVTFSERIFPLNWCKLKNFKELQMKKTLLTFLFNDRMYVTEEHRKKE